MGHLAGVVDLVADHTVCVEGEPVSPEASRILVRASTTLSPSFEHMVLKQLSSNLTVPISSLSHMALKQLSEERLKQNGKQGVWKVFADGMGKFKFLAIVNVGLHFLSFWKEESSSVKNDF